MDALLDNQSAVEELMEVSRSSLCLTATLNEEERLLLFTAVELMWYEQPVQDSAGAELKKRWTSLLEDLDNVQSGAEDKT